MVEAEKTMSDFPPGRPTITEQAVKHATDLAKVKTEAPSRFVVGGTIEGRRVTGGLSYSRSWRTGWGAVAFARAWYDDAPVIPTDKFGYVIGGELVKEFKPRRPKPTP